MSSSRELPNVAEMLAPLLGRLPSEQRPLLIAAAERLAAERYRGWAHGSSEARRALLLACAEREEEIASRIEALYPDATALQRDILARNPGFADLNRSVFEGRPLDEQYGIQAQGERIGASTWRSFARQAKDSQARQTFLDCAELEEQSARVLDSLLSEERQASDAASPGGRGP